MTTKGATFSLLNDVFPQYYEILGVTFQPRGFIFEEMGVDFGFIKLDDDDEDGRGHLLAPKFGLRDVRSGNTYIVKLHLRDKQAGAIAHSWDDLVIILAAPLENKWWADGLLVSLNSDPTGPGRKRVEYAAAVNVSQVLQEGMNFRRACVSSAPIPETEWLIT